MKDHEIRELVNQLRDVAIKYHGAGQLREQIARVVRGTMLQAGNSPVIPDGYMMVPMRLTAESVDSVTGGWIPVSERMPEAEGHYLVWANASRIDGYCDHLAIATYQGGEWSNEFNWLVTHWMPLPAAPQEVKSES